EENVFINSSHLPKEYLVGSIKNLQSNQALFHDDEIVAFYAHENQEEVGFDTYEQILFEQECTVICKPYDIFGIDDIALRADFDLITEGMGSEPIADTVQYLGKENIFIEEAAVLIFVILAALSGPIY